MIEIARFAPADQDGIWNVILPIQREEFGIAITKAEQTDLAAIPDFYQNGVGDFWVAKAGGEVVGTIALKDIGAGQAALRKMFVRADYRGKTHGVAARLLEHLLAEARARGVREIFLGTTDKFLAAHRFYEKNAFTEISTAALPPSFPLMAVDSKFYMIALTNPSHGARA